LLMLEQAPCLLLSHWYEIS